MRQLDASEREIITGDDFDESHLFVIVNGLVYRRINLCWDSFPAPLGAVFFKAPGVGEGTPATDSAVGDAYIHDFKDFPGLPLLGFIEGVIQRVLVELLGTELITRIGFHEAIDLSGYGIFLLVIFLFPGQLLFHLPAQMRAAFS